MKENLNYNEVSAALVNYEVRRQDRLSSLGSTTAEALAIRDRSFNQKGRGVQRRSKSRLGFRDLKRNQYALYKELGHWKVDCPKAKGKKKESITEANLAQMFSTHASTSQADGSMVVMKGVRWNNLYYLKGSTVIGQVETSISSDDDCAQV